MRLYWRAISYFRPDLKLIFVALGLMALATFAGLLQPYPVAVLFDYVFGGVRPVDRIPRAMVALLPQGKPGQIVALAGMVLALRFVRELLGMFQTFLNIRVGYNGTMRVRCDLFRKLQALSLAYHKSQPQGDAIYRLSYDTFGPQNVYNTVVQTVLVNAVTLVIMAGLMFSMDWRLTLVALSVTPILLWITNHYTKIFQERATEAKAYDTQLSTAIQRSVATIGLVQAFGREHDEYQNFQSAVGNTVKSYMKMHWQEVTYLLLIGSAFGLGTTLIVGYGGYTVYRDQYVTHPALGGMGMTTGKLFVFMTYFISQLYEPLNKLSSSGVALAGAVVAARRVFEVLDRDPVISDAPGAVTLARQPRALTLDHLSFGYRPDQSILKDVSCTIQPGQMVAFVGQSGVGKTTLLNLLPRFYDPTQGGILLDGHDLRNVKIASLRQHVALVLQENVVLPTSVAENIAYGWPKATLAQVRKAAEMAGAAEFIEKLPGKYDEQVSESGQNLSGGQRQRISIARALLTEAPIIVMDEPTSALDPQHEQLIIETLRRLKGHRTIILVSHRLSTVADCDRIFVMHEGRIVEQGTHDQLVAQHGLYFKMARHQMKLADPAEAKA